MLRHVMSSPLHIVIMVVIMLAAMGGADDDEMKSLFGTFGTWRDVLRESAMRLKADIGGDSLFNRGEITLAPPAESLFIRPLLDLDHCLAAPTTGRT
jgi:hypothetical protein